ncbi:MAG: glycosyltransferase [Candidatus Bathyarchaeota archaeon]|nr:glycosyltransferase [Candidatus Bathyarchaeota archaeon]
MGEFRLSVVIVTYNRCTDLSECLNSLFSSNDSPSEIIVVDSNSTDGTHRLAKSYPLKLVNIKERSMVKARNVGFQNAEGDIVAYVDDDVVVNKDWSKQMLIPYTDKNVGGVVGRVLPYNNAVRAYLPTKNNAIGKVFNNGFILGNFDIPTQQPIEVDTVIGCNMSFRRELLQKTGGFDENFRGSCFRDDTDMSLRVKKLGCKIIYQPKAIAQHKFKGKTVNNKWFYWTVYNHTYFYLKNFQPINLQKIISYLCATFLPPPDYVKKTGIRIKPTPLAVVYSAAGLINGAWIHRKGNPARIEKIFRIE